MSLVLGCALGLGLVLGASPFLWPAAIVRPDGSCPRVVTGTRNLLAQAGLHSVSLPMLVVVSAVVALASAALVYAVVPVVALVVTVGLAALALPLMVVSWRARRRRRATRTIWPDVVDHLVSAVRSGLALPDGIVALAHTGPATIREDFDSFGHDYRATGDFAISVDRLKERLADSTADRILETLRMSRQVGGSDLAIVLRDLASYLRAEAAIRAEVEARQSWVVNAARLGVVSPWIILLLLATRPEAAAAYNTAAGFAVITIGLVVSVVAYRVMLALGRLPEEKRWFR